jgi:SAM-dependent methyltransferase
MIFDVSADAYLRFMGRYSEPLAAQFADLAGLDGGTDPGTQADPGSKAGPGSKASPGRRLLDVGCGPGALTAELVRRAGAAAVSAVEPSASFAAAVRERLPGVDVRQAPAERLPFATATFDTTLAQLVVHFMADPVLGLEEMGRVTRPGGVVAACVWDHGGDRGPLSVFWSAVREVDPAADDESDRPGARDGDLARLFTRAGLSEIQVTTLTVRAPYASFDQWWEPFTLGVGPAGAHVASLSPADRAALRERCRRLLPAAPAEVTATAWAATGRT